MPKDKKGKVGEIKLGKAPAVSKPTKKVSKKKGEEEAAPSLAVRIIKPGKPTSDKCRITLCFYTKRVECDVEDNLMATDIQDFFEWSQEQCTWLIIDGLQKKTKKGERPTVLAFGADPGLGEMSIQKLDLEPNAVYIVVVHDARSDSVHSLDRKKQYQLKTDFSDLSGDQDYLRKTTMKKDFDRVTAKKVEHAMKAKGSKKEKDQRRQLIEKQMLSDFETLLTQDLNEDGVISWEEYLSHIGHKLMNSERQQELENLLLGV